MLVSLLALSLMVSSGQAPKEKEKQPELSAEAKKELKKLEGKWQVVKGLGSEGEHDLKDNEAFCLVEGTKMTFSRVNAKSNEMVEVTALDRSTDPKCIDLTDIRPGKPPRITEGVYKIDGDTLQLAIAAPKGGKLRPANFDKPTDQRIIVWTMKRVKD
jgi:uncharacterized protein (TIGR03067 family)